VLVGVLLFGKRGHLGCIARRVELGIVWRAGSEDKLE